MHKSKLTKSKSRHKRQITTISEIESVRQKAVQTRPNLPKLLTWANKIANHLHLYQPSVEDNKNYHFYRVVVESIRDLQVTSSKRNNYVQLGCSLFDVKRETVVGKTYFSEMMEVEGTSVQCQKSMYVYTAMEDMVMKVDVWRLQADRNRAGSDFMARRFYLGQFQADLTHSNETGRRSKTFNKEEENRFVFVEAEEQDRQATGDDRPRMRSQNTTVSYQTMNTHSLSYLQIFIPPEVFIDENDSILGIKDGRINQGQIVADQRSKMRFNVEEVAVPRSTIKAVGTEAEELVMRMQNVSGLPMHSLKELLLHVEFHNGWKSVCQQILPLKQKEANASQIMGTSRMGLDNKSTIKKSAKLRDTAPVSHTLTYHYDKMKELNAVFLKEGGALLIWIEARLEVKYETKEKGGKQQKQQIVSLPVAFALKDLNDMEDERVQKFQLVPGNPFNPVHITQYLATLKDSNKQEIGNSKNRLYCQLMFYLIKSKGGADSIGKDNIEKGTEEIQSLKAEKDRLVRVHRKLREEKRKKLIEMNQQIPFLDPTKLKQELYEQKIQKVRREKEEKQEALLFLKARVNHLEREALVSNYKVQNEQVMDNSTVKLVQKMPELFLDYKPEDPKDARQEGIVLNIFNAYYCRKMQKGALLCDTTLVAEYMAKKTYLNIRLIGLTSIRNEFKEFQLIVYDFEGRAIKLPGVSDSCKPEDHRSMNVPIPNEDPQTTRQILNGLLNGFMPMYLQCQSFTKLRGLALVDLGELLQKAGAWGMHSAQIQCKSVFSQEENQIAQLDLAISFSQTYTEEEKLSGQDIGQSICQNISGLLLPNKKEFNMLNRIKKYKEQRTSMQVPAKKEEAIKKALAGLSMQKIKLRCVRDRSQLLRLRVRQSGNLAKLLAVKISDQDEKYLTNPQIWIVYRSVNITDQLVQFKTKDTIQLKPNQEEPLMMLQYISLRKVTNTSLSNLNYGSHLNQYNHPHKIVITLTEPQTHVVWQVFQIEVIPKNQPNALVMEVYSQGKKNAILPIPCSNIEVYKNQHEVRLMPTKAVVCLPEVQQTEWTLSQFTLAKIMPGMKEKMPFQAVELYVWGSSQQAIDGRLWQEEDLLLKLPLSEILKREMQFNYSIDSLAVYSRHVDLRVKGNTGFSYESTMTFSRKNSDIYIRAKIHCHSIGQLTYPVEIIDQLGAVVYRIAVLATIAFPTLSTSQVFNLKVPTENLQQSETFSYQNHTSQTTVFTTRALRPHLLRIAEDKFEVRANDAINLHLRFDWGRITRELREEDKSQCQLMVGVTSEVVMDYFLFRCRLK